MALIPYFLLLEDGRLLLQEDGNRGIILYFLEVADTPTERIYSVPVESRVIVPADDRGLIISAQDRELITPEQDRSLGIEIEGRTFSIRRE